MKNQKVFLFYMLMLFSLGSFAQEIAIKTISVQGFGEVKVKPDVANITFNLSATNLDFKKAVNELNSKVNSLSKALRKIGVPKEEIYSSNYNINKEFKHNYKTGEKIFLGFKVSHSIALQVGADTKSVNKVFSALIKSLDDIELNLSFGIKDIEKLKDIMIANAIKDANKKANVIAETAKVQLGDIISINYNVAPMHNRGSSNYVSLSKKMATAPVMVDDFNPADITQKTSVSIVWKIE
jgi:uncharacterized protein YggE